MREAFAMQKLLTFFQQNAKASLIFSTKNTSVSEILKVEILTKITMSLVLNNRAQVASLIFI